MITILEFIEVSSLEVQQGSIYGEENDWVELISYHKKTKETKLISGTKHGMAHTNCEGLNRWD